MRAVTRLGGALLVAALVSVVFGCSGGSDDPSALKSALTELTSVPAPAGAVQDGGGAHGCRRDDWEGDTEPSATADFRVATEQSGSVLDGWYLPRWRDLGWVAVAGQPGVIERTVDGEAVRAHVQEMGKVGDQFACSIVVGFTADRCS